MTDAMQQATEIFKDRLLSNIDLVSADEQTNGWFQDIGLPVKSTVAVRSGRILIADPGYLCKENFYSSEDSPTGDYLKQNGVVLVDFGGDISGPVTRCAGGGYKIVLTHQRITEDGYPVFQGDGSSIPETFMVAEQSPGVDSGGLIFIDYSPELQELIASQLQAMRDDMYLLLEAKPGAYWIGYEQWDIDPEHPYPAWYRNIVIMPL